MKMETTYEEATPGIGRGTRIDNKATVTGNEDGTPFVINGKQMWIAVLDAVYRDVGMHARQREMCQRLSLNDTQCGSPSAEALTHIWRHRDYIDSMDPTAEANPSKKLNNWGFGCMTGAAIWSSFVTSGESVACMFSGGDVLYYSKNAHFGILPVFEIPA